MKIIHALIQKTESGEIQWIEERIEGILCFDTQFEGKSYRLLKPANFNDFGYVLWILDSQMKPLFPYKTPQVKALFKGVVQKVYEIESE